MHIADDARLVLRWTCQECKHVNYHGGSNSHGSEEAKKDAAEDFGVSTEDLACIPEVLCCLKCEAAHKLPDDFGIPMNDNAADA